MLALSVWSAVARSVAVETRGEGREGLGGEKLWGKKRKRDLRARIKEVLESKNLEADMFLMVYKGEMGEKDLKCGH